jgi:hypothetical protein
MWFGKNSELQFVTITPCECLFVKINANITEEKATNNRMTLMTQQIPGFEKLKHQIKHQIMSSFQEKIYPKEHLLIKERETL